ncbi:MAG: saccharopine dehydrogenase NADP-binding domain-containing protein [Pseudomonadota bacterium]
MSDKAYDVVVYGASGFTGRLVAEYLQHQYGDDDSVRWAMAGRNAEKLAAVRDEMGISDAVQIIVADGSDESSLQAMAAQTKAIITTVGPYQLYGEALVAVCAKTGTDYLDLCGEPAWMRDMIDAYESTAKASGARIVFSSGFDSIPSDLGVWRLQQECIKQTGKPSARIRGRVRKMQGTFSGGTAASLKATLKAAASDPEVERRMKDPHSLVPGHKGAPQPPDYKPYLDEALGSWVTPFVMAAINTRNVLRTNALLGFAYGEDFQYDEMTLTGPGEKGQQIAMAMIERSKEMASDKGPKPGEGPSKEERENGFYDFIFVAETDQGPIKLGVTGDRDPGYGSTSKMLAEAALCLVKDRPEQPGGIWTPASALGQPLIDRLVANAGLTFGLE